MKKTYLAVALAVATFFACNSGTSSKTADSTTFNDTSHQSTFGQQDTSAAAANGAGTMNDTANAKPLSDMDKQFAMDIAAGGNTEITASQIATTMAQNQRVKDFANMMINDHTKAGNELKTLASQHNVTLPDSVMPKQHDKLETLRKTSAKNFDKQYIDMMVQDHKEAVSKFQMASQKCDNSDLRTWASNTLPTIKMHLDSAQAIQKALK